MDAEYFRDHICDELLGAKCYVKNAIEIKAMNAAWAKNFSEMSTAELNHAAALYRMFEEYYKTTTASYSKVPDYLESIKKEVVECYTEESAKIRYLHEMFSK